MIDPTILFSQKTELVTSLPPKSESVAHLLRIRNKAAQLRRPQRLATRLHRYRLQRILHSPQHYYSNPSPAFTYNTTLRILCSRLCSAPLHIKIEIRAESWKITLATWGQQPQASQPTTNSPQNQSQHYSPTPNYLLTVNLQTENKILCVSKLPNGVTHAYLTSLLLLWAAITKKRCVC
jgi:hypothetical protein